MKITVLCNSIIPNGGTERAISNLIHILSSDERYIINIISLSSNPDEKPAFDFGNAIIYHLGLHDLRQNFLNKIVWYIIALKNLIPIIKMISPDIILGYGHNINVLLPFIKIKKIKLYGCEHINYDTIPYSSKIIMKFIYPFLDGIIVLSKTAKQKYARLNKKICIIPNALSFFQLKPALLDCKRIIMIGRLSKEKGYERLIPIAHKLRERYPLWNIDIYGDGPLKDELYNIFYRENLLDIVHFKGLTKDIQGELNKSSILLMTSYTEALPMAILEAKACGVPTVAYRCEGTNELIINGSDGFLVADSDTFYNKLELLIEDHQLLKLFGERAYNKAKEYSACNIKKSWDRLFIE